jgi:hypothetical protein
LRHERTVGNRHDRSRERLRIAPSKKQVEVCGQTLPLAISHYALVCVLADKFTADDDEAKHHRVLDELVAKLRSLFKAHPDWFNDTDSSKNIPKQLLRLEKAVVEHDTTPLSQLLNGLRRRLEAEACSKEAARFLLDALPRPGEKCALRLNRRSVVLPRETQTSPSPRATSREPLAVARSAKL